MKSERHLSLDVSDKPHGTRSRYVAGKCRCDECKQANTLYRRERMTRLRELESSVSPSNRAMQGFIVRAGKTFIVRLCPGANGEDCPFGQGKRGAWLRGSHAVCARCVERATVWNGLVSAKAARAHMIKLRRAGVGYKSLAEAGDVSRTVCMGILDGSVTQIRKDTERKILNVDSGARAGGVIVSATAGNEIIAKLRARGLTLTKIAELLGYQSKHPVQLGKRSHMRLETRARLQRLWRRLEREASAPDPNDLEREAPDLVPGQWLDDDGSVLPAYRSAVASRRKAAR